MEEKDLQRLLDMLYGMIDEAKSAPFSAEKCTINRDEALDILTEIRSRMPLEIKKAQELIRVPGATISGFRMTSYFLPLPEYVSHRFGSFLQYLPS